MINNKLSKKKKRLNEKLKRRKKHWPVFFHDASSSSSHTRNHHEIFVILLKDISNVQKCEWVRFMKNRSFIIRLFIDIQPLLLYCILYTPKKKKTKKKQNKRVPSSQDSLCVFFLHIRCKIHSWWTYGSIKKIQGNIFFINVWQKSDARKWMGWIVIFNIIICIHLLCWSFPSVYVHKNSINIKLIKAWKSIRIKNYKSERLKVNGKKSSLERQTKNF